MQYRDLTWAQNIRMSCQESLFRPQLMRLVLRVVATTAEQQLPGSVPPTVTLPDADQQGQYGGACGEGAHGSLGIHPDPHAHASISMLHHLIPGLAGATNAPMISSPQQPQASSLPSLPHGAQVPNSMVCRAKGMDFRLAWGYEFKFHGNKLVLSHKLLQTHICDPKPPPKVNSRSEWSGWVSGRVADMFITMVTSSKHHPTYMPMNITHSKASTKASSGSSGAGVSASNTAAEVLGGTACNTHGTKVIACVNHGASKPCVTRHVSIEPIASVNHALQCLHHKKSFTNCLLGDNSDN